VPRQTTVLPTSKFYEEEFAQAYAQYDPDEANRLLDEMGMKDVDGDGIRERPDGRPLAVTLEWIPMETPKELITELVVDQWRKVGIDIRLKEVSESLQLTRANASLMQMTLWHADRCTDILFPLEPYWFAPTHIYWETCMWNEWTRWFFTDGTRGEEPPPIIKDLYNWWDGMNTTLDEEKRLELGKKLLQAQAENIWTIGTVGLAPHPIIVSNKLHNVPKNGYWGWDGRFSAPYHPETWYLKEEK
jgi:peptide/nickel transport system substrate-binding protein